MRNLFNMDNGLFRVLGRVADLMILNLLFIVCSIPIITIGPALTAMFYVTLKISVNEEGYIVRSFFKSFRQNFRQALILWLLTLLLTVILVTDLLILRSATGTAYTILRVLILATAFVFYMTFLYIFPTLARFDNTIRRTLRNALLMSIIDFPRTVLMVIISIGAAFITFYNGYTFWYGLLFWILLGFATIAYINSRFFSKIFKKYMPEEKQDEEDDNWELADVDENAGELPDNSDEETAELPEKSNEEDTGLPDNSDEGTTELPENSDEEDTGLPDNSREEDTELPKNSD